MDQNLTHIDLRLHNTHGGSKEVFTPLDSNHVRIYACGPTVYDRPHVGNARPAVVFDVLVRILRRLYPKVTYVRNITDVDDKIIAATKDGDISGLTRRMEDAYHRDMAELNVLAPDVEPRATEHIAQMIVMIKTLIAAGNAYISQSHVVFASQSWPHYGALSGHDSRALRSGARIEVADYKRSPQDFILWKPAPTSTPGWDSPWGYGRPGWHIECSAMSDFYLGTPFDIHVGGLDLIFPHHENEIAQSCCAHGVDTMARFWLHNGYVTMEGLKMSKSLGNVALVGDIAARGEVIRYFILSTHYRHPLDWTKTGLVQATARLDSLYQTLLLAAEDGLSDADYGHDNAKDIWSSLCDDLNTPKALATLHRYASQIHKESGEKRRQALAALRHGALLLGLLQQSPDTWFHGKQDGLDGQAVADIEAEIKRRDQAKQEKDYVLADNIRNQLQGRGILLEDTAMGTRWKWATDKR